MKKITNLKSPTKNVTTRSGSIHGVDYIIAPVNMIVEGVLSGSMGPILYTSNEMEQSLPFWDGVPVTINHPTDVSGNNVSARSPEVIENFGVGNIFNCSYDSETKTLKADAYINKQLLQDKFPDLYNKIATQNANIEVSVGVLFEEQENPGEFNGIAYNSSATNMHGDHLALLPNDTGACSWNDGCGLRNNKKEKKHNIVFNELSHSQVDTQLSQYVDSMDDNSYVYYIRAVYGNYFVYKRQLRRSQENEPVITLWKQSYTNINDIIATEGEAQQVTETTQYTSVTNTGDIDKPKTNKEGGEMAKVKPCCPEKVKSLIETTTNTFTDSDEEFLLSLNEKQLESALAMNQNVHETEKEDIPEMTINKFIKTAPEEIQAVLNGLLKKESDERSVIIENLFKNEDCLFEKEELESMSTVHLNKLSGLVFKMSATNTTTVTDNSTTDMTGSAGADDKSEIPGTKTTLADNEVLVPKKIDWAKK